jgi:hypothetical protein
MTAPRRPPGRYDERSALPRQLQVGLAVVGGLLLVGLAYLAFDRFSGSGVRSGTLGYRVRSDTEVQVRYQVTRPLGTTVVCAVQATGRDGSVVGAQDVRLDPTDREDLVTTTTLTTTARAATAQVLGCRTAPSASSTP